MSNSDSRIIIAGGGIAGMATALALLQRGYDVELFEQAHELKEVGAGVQISPNGCRALDALGVFDAVRRESVDPERKEFRLWNTGKSWLMFDLGGGAVSTYGYPYLTVYRPDLLAALIDGVKALKPDAIHLGKRVAGFEQDADSVTLRLEDGSEHKGVALIGCDGVRSVIRNQLWGESNPRYSGMVAWRGVIPMELLPERLRTRNGYTWIGPGGHAVSYPLRRGTLMNFVGTIERKDWVGESWSLQGDAQECKRDFAGWHEDLHAMIDSAPTLFKWALMVREPMPKWTSGRITLAGDAAHPTLPFLAQGAVHSIEDAVVLGRCFEKYMPDIPTVLQKYEDARIERTSRMVRGATANTDRFHSAELATEEGAEAYLKREWSREPIKERYDWLYRYDVLSVPV